MTQVKGLVVTMDENSEPIKIELDGTPVFASTLDIQYRPKKPALIKMTAYARDISGHRLTVEGPDGNLVLEDRQFYAVSKEDFELLQATKAAARAAQ